MLQHPFEDTPVLALSQHDIIPTGRLFALYIVLHKMTYLLVFANWHVLQWMTFALRFQTNVAVF